MDEEVKIFKGILNVDLLQMRIKQVLVFWVCFFLWSFYIVFFQIVYFGITARIIQRVLDYGELDVRNRYFVIVLEWFFYFVSYSI